MSKKLRFQTAIARADSLILTVRGERVMLDSDLASIYGVPTKRLNEQVKRNLQRFPEDLCFRLTSREVYEIRSQFATASLGSSGIRSHIATGRCDKCGSLWKGGKNGGLRISDAFFPSLKKKEGSIR